MALFYIKWLQALNHKTARFEMERIHSCSSQCLFLHFPFVPALKAVAVMLLYLLDTSLGLGDHT